MILGWWIIPSYRLTKEEFFSPIFDIFRPRLSPFFRFSASKCVGSFYIDIHHMYIHSMYCIHTVYVYCTVLVSSMYCFVTVCHVCTPKSDANVFSSKHYSSSPPSSSAAAASASAAASAAASSSAAAMAAASAARITSQASQWSNTAVTPANNAATAPE